MQHINALEAIVVRRLAQRGLPRAPGPLNFEHRGVVVRVTVNESLYRGLFVTVHDHLSGKRQFRAQEGVYDWDAVAACVVAVVESRLPQPKAPQPRASGPITEAPLSIRRSHASPGRLRVKLDEMELDPVSVMQLYALIQRASPAAGRSLPEIDGAMI